MASAFQRGRSDIYIASFKAWSAALGRCVWRTQSTGVRDYSAAIAIARTLENGSQAAMAGSLTRSKAAAMVNDILRLAGLEELAPAPSLALAVKELTEGAEVAKATARKYAAQWTTLKEWADERAERPVSAWTTAMISDYYRHCRERFSATTANDHLRFVGMVFSRAVKLGHVTNNPVEAVTRHRNDSVEKETITRGQQAALLRAMRKAKRRDWCCLAGLGWHTGHRLQDLLDATKATGDLLTLNPRKKGGRGREVVLPLPRWLAGLLTRLKGFQSIENADNRNGRVSEQFIGWLKLAGIDPLPVQRGARIVHCRSFHSYRHSMQSRLTAAGISGELARLVTDHESPKVARRYVHAEIESLREALKKTKNRK
ncbi:MAG: hypothetical protein IPK32_13945 [Verrucomicrobiaceae bacterium]|nr:hypothetical protein [Verrucomicrobiaceae bacterium]